MSDEEDLNAQRARNTRQSFQVTDSELASGLGVSLPTAGKYRRELASLGLLEVVEQKRGKNKEIAITKVKY